MNKEDTKTREGPASEDLTEIKGIGGQFAEALRSAGISSTVELARFGSPDELYEHLVGRRVTKITRSRIEDGDWLEQAKARVGQRPEAVERLERSEAPVQRSQPSGAEDRNSTRKTEPIEDASESSQVKGADRLHSEFTLFFDDLAGEADEEQGEEQHLISTAYHDETGEEEVFQGVDPSLWARWILEKAKLPVPLALRSTNDGADASGVPRIAPDAARIDIASIDIHTPKSDPDVRADELQAEVSFRISGTAAETLAAEEIPFRLEINLVEMDEGRPSPVVLAEGRLKPDVFEYAQRHTFLMPAVGSYRLSALVYGLPPSGFSASREGPILRVIDPESSSSWR